VPCSSRRPEACHSIVVYGMYTCCDCLEAMFTTPLGGLRTAHLRGCRHSHEHVYSGAAGGTTFHDCDLLPGFGRPTCPHPYVNWGSYFSKDWINWGLTFRSNTAHVAGAGAGSTYAGVLCSTGVDFQG
jgi:hypothetical protein